jgi:enolase 1/2/3
MAMKISRVVAREVLDCRGLPTVQVDVWVDDRLAGRADVPAGRSTGKYEAKEVRDGGSRFGGFGVRRAVANVRDVIGPAVVGQPVSSQRSIDELLIELDGTSDKSRLGANAIVGVSLAVARAAAASSGAPLYRHLDGNSHVLPVPQINLINGGRHASNDLDFQEFIIMPIGAESFIHAMQIGTEVNLQLADLLLGRYGKLAINTGDEGGYAPPITDPREALALLHQAVDQAGYTKHVVYGLDCASTHFYDKLTRAYRLATGSYTMSMMLDLYAELVRDFNVVSIEDPLYEDDFEGFAEATKRLRIQIVGDDLFVTNSGRLQKGIDSGAANSLLWKVNQIGTLSEALDAAALARKNGYSVVVSERSGETEDPIIADLVVALNAGQIKTGAPVRGERTAKYNRLLLIEEELGDRATYAGTSYRAPKG